MKQVSVRTTAIATVAALAVGIASGLGVWAIQRSRWTSDLAEERRIAQEASAALYSLEASLTARIADLESRLTSETGPSVEPTATQPPDSSSPSDEGSPPEILERSVDPEMTDPGDPLTFRVRVSGNADSVTVRIENRSSGRTENYPLGLVPGGSEVRLWETTVAAPSEPGEYRYFATARLGATAVDMPGTSGWTFFVR